MMRKASTSNTKKAEEGYEGYFKVPVAAIFDDFFGMVDAAMSMDEVAPASPDDYYRSIWDSFGAGSGCVL